MFSCLWILKTWGGRTLKHQVCRLSLTTNVIDSLSKDWCSNITLRTETSPWVVSADGGSLSDCFKDLDSCHRALICLNLRMRFEHLHSTMATPITVVLESVSLGVTSIDLPTSGGEGRGGRGGVGSLLGIRGRTFCGYPYSCLKCFIRFVLFRSL